MRFKKMVYLFFLFVFLLGCSQGPIGAGMNQQDFAGNIQDLSLNVKSHVNENNGDFEFWPVKPTFKMREAIVERIIDGDTLVTTDKETIRFIGVNCPEVKDKEGNYNNPEPYAVESTDYTSSILTPGKKIYLEIDEKNQLDKFNRTLAYIWIQQDNTIGMFNALLVSNGYAEVMTIKPHTTYSHIFVELEKEAKEKKLGMWE